MSTSTTPRPRRLWGVIGLVCAALVATGCGSASSAQEPPATEGSAAGGDGSDVTIGYFPLVHTASIVHAEQAGYLADGGIDAELTQTEGGAAAIPALISGDVDILYSNYTSVLLAAERGLPVVMISGNDIAADDHGIFVPEDSPVESLEDLDGKSFAVNNLQNIGTVALYAQLEELGLTRDAVDLVEMPNPDMAAAATNGNVDAIWQVEPFQTLARQAGLKRIADMFAGPAQDMPVGGWVTTREFAENNPEVIAAFQEALRQSTEDLSNNRELHLELVPEYTQISADVAEELALPHYDAELKVDALQSGADLMVEYGIISEELDVASLTVAP